MLQKAQTKARALVLEAAIPVPSMMEFILAKAAANAKAIDIIARGETAPAAAAPAAKEEKEEKKDEGDTAAGLGALFG